MRLNYSKKSLLLLSIDLLLLLPLIYFQCIWGLGDNSFGRGDQTHHAQVVQHMVQTGEWWTPMKGGKPYFNKPPFKMWVSAIVIKLFGETNFNYRIIDGLSGVGTTLLTYFFARALFSSRLAGILAAISLLGCHNYFFGHGVREAVQDGVMIFFVTLAIICAWYFAEELKKLRDKGSTPSRNFYRIATLGGIAIGLAVFTKNVAGYIAFAVIGSYFLFAGLIPLLFRRGKKALMFTVGWSILLPAIYIVPQLLSSKSVYRVMFFHEVYKRATRGYHNVHKEWFYLKSILFERGAVPPELLVISLIFALYFIFLRKDSRYLFVTCWSLVPVICYSLAKSKLRWYINPAFPGMSILIGALLASMFHNVREATVGYINCEKKLSLKACSSLILFIAGLSGLTFHFGAVAYDIYTIRRRTEFDQFVEHAKQVAPELKSSDKILVYKEPRFSVDEALYLKMMPYKKISSSDELKSLDQSSVVIAPASSFTEIAQVREFSSYIFIRPRHQRNHWLTVLTSPDFPAPTSFQTFTQEIDFGSWDRRLIAGWKSPEAFHGLRIRSNIGKRSTLLFDADRAFVELDSKIELNIASNVKTDLDYFCNVSVYINERKISELTNLKIGFHPYLIDIPKGSFHHGPNMISFVHEYSDGHSVGDTEILAFYDYLKIHLGEKLASSDKI